MQPISQCLEAVRVAVTCTRVRNDIRSLADRSKVVVVE
ncbi:hypothetical protein APY03_3174 [Variovorax sp. WDL1]|nr:hypothetical protein APY03_3174 [Variovorax sp. WDL1]